MSIDPRDLFVSLNPLGLDERELEKDSTGFADMRTHNDYLAFLAGYKAGTVDGEERECQSHRPMNAEGCTTDDDTQACSKPFAVAAPCRSLDKAEGGMPDSYFMLSRIPCAGAADGRGLNKAEGGTPDSNSLPSSRLMIQASGNKIEVEVTGHCAGWWSRPGYHHGKNLKTNKVRTVHHTAVMEVRQ